ncbi:hypothetical protein [Candidatus Poriferisodalis sp.]|uniref:hypothetical protein n=1 Tax=Candidatus Poriferisodalis sp. TaxID=3101277 RepID=UPI003AF68F40
MTVRALESAYMALEEAYNILRGAVDSQLLKLHAARTLIHQDAERVTDEAIRDDLSFGQSLVPATHVFGGSDYEDDGVACDAAKQMLVATARALQLLASNGCAVETARVVGRIADVCKLAEEDLTSVIDLVQSEDAQAPAAGGEVPFAAEELEYRWQAVAQVLEGTEARQGESEQIADD